MAQPKNVANVLAGLLESGAHSDLTLVCQGIEFKVHRAIACSWSRVIENAIGGSSKVRAERDPLCYLSTANPCLGIGHQETRRRVRHQRSPEHA